VSLRGGRFLVPSPLPASKSADVVVRLGWQIDFRWDALTSQRPATLPEANPVVGKLFSARCWYNLRQRAFLRHQMTRLGNVSGTHSMTHRLMITSPISAVGFSWHGKS
jgi:hypothetical protein